MSTEPYRDSAASEETSPTVAKPPGSLWKSVLGVMLYVAYLAVLLIDGIPRSPMRLIEFAIFAAIFVTGVIGAWREFGRQVLDSPWFYWGERRFQQQCEREAVKARRARWKARKLAEREAARAAVSDETPGA